MRSLLVALLWGCTGSPPQEQAEREERVIVDTTRETPAYGGQAYRPERAIELVVWSAPHPRPHTRPLVLLAHGIDGHPNFFEGLALRLAEDGLVVAAPAFPSTHSGNDAGYSGLQDLPNQPGDLRVVLDALQRAAADREDSLYRRFDPDRVGALGHSFGAITVLGWTRHPCCYDPRVEAVVQVSTPVALRAAFGEQPFDRVGAPVVLVHGEQDGTVPFQQSVDLTALLDDELGFVRLAGVTHSELVEGTGDVPARRVTEDVALGLFGEFLRGEEGALEAAFNAVESEIVRVDR